MEGFDIGLESYTKESLKCLCGNPRVRGVVLGDLLCTKRMFPGGIAEEIGMLSLLMESGKEIFYQTPLYVTSRNWEEVCSILEMLSKAEQQVHVLIQDMGVAAVIREHYPMYQVVWGQMARDREHRFSRSFLKVLQQAGISGMETGSEETARRLNSLGITPYWVYGSLGYQTVGRVCYLKYQTGACDRSACLSGEYCMKEKEGSFSMTMDGYLMGKSLHYKKSKEPHRVLVYAETEEKLEQCLKGWEEQ